MTICLGIESTAHTFAVGVVDEKGNVLADKRTMFKPESGGIIPAEAANHHTKTGIQMIIDALIEANITMKDADIIAFAQGPGLPPCLRVGATIARYLSIIHKKDLIGVNHPVGHIEIGRLNAQSEDPIVVYLSGGNTQIIGFADGLYRVFGETIDVPVGNALDVVARAAGWPMPGGPEIEKHAKNGEYIEFPYVVKGMDLSFSGISTEAIIKLKNGALKGDVAYSMQETCFSMLVEVSERALAHTGKKEVLLVGGVAANKRLQEMMRIMCKERGAQMKVVDFKYAGDNGTMIAWAGVLAHGAGERTSVVTSKIRQNWRTDEVDIKWF